MGNKLDKQYQDLVRDIIENGVVKKDRTGTGTKSLFGRQIRHKMSEGFPLLTTKKMAWKPIVTELIWFLRGDTNIQYLVKNNCNIWVGDCYKKYKNKFLGYEDIPDINLFIHEIKTNDEFAKKWGELGPVYGKQWRNWGGYSKTSIIQKEGLYDEIRFENKKGIDQIQNLINDLKTNPDSRRLMVNAWNVGELDQMTLPPCHFLFQCYTRELTFQERLDIYDPQKLYHNEVDSWFLDELNIPTRAISLIWNQRSVDTGLGLPFNIASYGLLLEIIAKIVNMVPDELIGNFGDTHLYLDHVEPIQIQLYRESFKLPKLNINTQFWSTEGGECGIGPINATAVFNGFQNENFCKCLLEDDIQLYDYQSHPTIKLPLSN